MRPSLAPTLVDDAGVVARVAAHLAPAFRGTGAAMIVARGERLPGLTRALAAHGIDVAAAQRAERLVTLDARATLAAITVDGRPDRARFDERVAAPVARLARRGALRIYSELLDVARGAGDARAMVRLDELWRGLQGEHGFSMLASYQLPTAPPAEHCAAAAEPGPATTSAPRTVAELEDRVRTLEELFAVLAHDLRNPLGTVTMGATVLLQLAPSGDAKAQRIRTIAERIQRQTERMTRQLTDVADFAELQAGRLTLTCSPQAPSEIIARTSDLVGPMAHERGVGFEVRTAASLDAVRCDAERVVQALTNLAANAMKVTPRGGAMEVGVRADGVRSVFYVRDGGPGLDRDELRALFAPGAHRRHASYRGTALGFAIAQAIVEAHGGRIWADSEAGAGCTVSFSVAPGD